MLRQIAKIQTMVNTLLGYCARAGADVGPPPDKYETLSVMILKAQDGDLPHRGMHELERWLRNDASAVEYYLNFQQLTVLLQMYFNPSRFRTDLPCETTV